MVGMFQHSPEYIFSETNTEKEKDKKWLQKSDPNNILQAQIHLPLKKQYFLWHIIEKVFNARKRRNFYLPKETSPWEAFENIAQIKVNVRNQMVVKSSQNWEI